jgi:hypothetical protein
MIAIIFMNFFCFLTTIAINNIAAIIIIIFTFLIAIAIDTTFMNFFCSFTTIAAIIIIFTFLVAVAIAF